MSAAVVRISTTGTDTAAANQRGMFSKNVIGTPSASADKIIAQPKIKTEKATAPILVTRVRR
jgi:hypothetical protein